MKGKGRANPTTLSGVSMVQAEGGAIMQQSPEIMVERCSHVVETVAPVEPRSRSGGMEWISGRGSDVSTNRWRRLDGSKGARSPVERQDGAQRGGSRCIRVERWRARPAAVQVQRTEKGNPISKAGFANVKVADSREKDTRQVDICRCDLDPLEAEVNGPNVGSASL